MKQQPFEAKREPSDDPIEFKDNGNRWARRGSSNDPSDIEDSSGESLVDQKEMDPEMDVAAKGFTDLTVADTSAIARNHRFPKPSNMWRTSSRAIQRARSRA